MTTLIVAADLASALPDAPAAALAALPARATAAAENYCNRRLALASYDEEYEPGSTRIVRLKRYPVVSLDAALTDLSDVLKIQHEAGPWRASFALQFADDPDQVAPIGLALSSTTGGVASPTTLAFAPPSPDAPIATVQQLADAINALGPWTAAVAPGMGDCPTAELRPVRGSVEALGRPAALQAYATTLGDYELSPATGKVTLRQVRADSYQYPTRTFGAVGYFAKMRFQYSAGFQGDPALGTVTTPPDLAEACVQAARAILDCRGVSGVIKSVDLGNTTIVAGDVAAIPPSARRLLDRYCDRRF